MAQDRGITLNSDKIGLPNLHEDSPRDGPEMAPDRGITLNSDKIGLPSLHEDGPKSRDYVK